MSKKQLYTNKEARDYLKTSSVTLWRERRDGNISFRRVGSKIVYLEEDLEDYLNRNKREASSIPKVEGGNDAAN